MTERLFPEAEPVPGREARPDAPLADRMRPRTLDELEGQEEIVGPQSVLRRAIEDDSLRSLIFWGPPGSGKTTLAWIIAQHTKGRFVPFSAVLSGVKELREILATARRERRASGKRTILFVDEIHRFNKAQQDAFLPDVERGEIVLIGATTENPSFEINAAVLSRSKVCVLQPLQESSLVRILQRALTEERGLGNEPVDVDDGVLEQIAQRSQGDARFALNTLELASSVAPDEQGRRHVTSEVLADALQRSALAYDKDGEEHFNLISALHKSMRSSDPDASVYWLARMVESGEEPLYIARRLVRFASEDVGNADPRALSIALAARDAVHFLGLPEGALALAQAAIYCATAPKSDSVYRAYGEALKAVRDGKVERVPLALRNAPTKLMSQLGYGKGYQHAHGYEQAVTDMDCLPPSLQGRRFYRPGGVGFEKTIRQLMESREELRARQGVQKKSTKE